MIDLDGALGEGGGGIVRTALSLSMVTGTPFRIRNVRAGREEPGLRRQHLTAVRAAAEVADASLEGDALGSRELSFEPRGVSPGPHRFSTGGAGSAVLVLQTILPPLLAAPGPSRIVVEGGTHNPNAPPFEFLERAFLPLVARLGPEISVRLLRPGFYPAGGGRIEARIRPAERLRSLALHERGEVRRRRARAIVASLPRHIAERELSIAHAMLGLRPDALEVEETEEAAGPGNAIMIEIECEHVTEVFTGFGRRGVPAEEVARGAARRALRYLEAEVPVGPHLADQLLVPLAAGAGGSYRTVGPTSHAETNVRVIRAFGVAEVSLREIDGEGERCDVEVTAAAGGG